MTRLDAIVHDVQQGFGLTKSQTAWLLDQVGDAIEALEHAHACATLRADGTCDGCFVSAALARLREDQ